MERKRILRNLSRLAVLATAAALAGPPVFAATYNLTAVQFNKTMPDGRVVPMWGYALNGGTPAVPGPRLVLPPGDTTLTIALTNALPAGNDTSIVIPGLTAPLAPVYFTDAQGRQRVRSLTAVTAPGATVSYTWTGLKAGTYLYHSGTHAQVQVQMGLYGAVTMNAVDATADAPAQAYPGMPYKTELVLFHSEVDPDLHDAVVNGSYGAGAFTSTFNYKPKYFLINGEPHTATAASIPAGQPNDPVLIRFLSAALKYRTPTMLGSSFDIVAEDANAYPYARKGQHSLLLSPLKTKDAIWTPLAAGTYPVFDRSLGLHNNSAGPGGMLAFLDVGGIALAAVDDSYTTAENTLLTTTALDGVLANDTPADAVKTAALVAGPGKGTIAFNADGSFTYTPNAGYFGPDSFTYNFTSAGRPSNTATVSITVTSGGNHAPVAVNDTATTTTGAPVAVNVLANDTDADGDTLTVQSAANGTNGTVAVAADSLSVTYTPNAGYSGPDSFTYVVSDGNGGTATGTVTVTVAAPVNIAPSANDDTAATKTNTAVIINLVANDSDPDGTIDPTTVTITVQPSLGGTVVNNLNGTVTFTPKRNFRGTDVFKYTVRDNAGALSNEATVRVNVTK